MSIINLLPWTSHAKRWETRMNADADHLIATLGEAAYGTAADRAWREDMGLLPSRDSGHWSRVTLEIGRRLALAEAKATTVAPRIGGDATPSYAQAA